MAVLCPPTHALIGFCSINRRKDASLSISFPTSLGILRLAHDFSPEQLEAACQRALALRSVSYRAIVTLLKSAPPIPPPALPKIAHENLRGAAYFAGTPAG